MTTYNEMTLAPRYHEQLLAWQQLHIPDLPVLLKHWNKHFPEAAPYRTVAKVAPNKDAFIQTGMFKGQRKLQAAGDMKGNMLYSAVRIIKAQCSTELGSIQQHQETLDQCHSDRTRFSVLRIMAEEFRHAYQMFWVLSHDKSWSTSGMNRLATNTIEELLAMHTGTHVLDAFNIPFHDPLDNIVFAFLVDRVGKYQLNMQKVFSYAPMACSMQPMLEEESFHLYAGLTLLKDIVKAAANDDGRWTLAEIQRRINAWYPRAAEMFGNPEAGNTNIVFSFKDRLNGESARSYREELLRLLRRLNREIVVARQPDLDETQIAEQLSRPDYADLLRLPHELFFRIRGPENMTYKMYSIDGHPMDELNYFRHLKLVLPDSLQQTDFFRTYRTHLDSTRRSIPS